MAFEPYGGQVWSGEPAPAVNPVQQQMLALSVAGAGVAGLLYAGTQVGDASWNAIDSVIEATTMVGDASPFGILNTFRVPEFLSPLASPGGQGLAGGLSGLTDGHMGYRWDKEFLKSHDTQLYLKTITGLSDAELYAKGIRPGMHGAPEDLASELIFERTAGSPRGSLYTMVGDEKRVLSNAVGLMRMTRDAPDIIDKDRLMNRAAFGVFQALDMWSNEGFNAERVLRLSPKVLEARGLKASNYMPVPSITGGVHSLGDLGRRTALLRAVPAFEMERFSRLAEGFVHQTFGPEGASGFKKLFGFGIGNLPGPASHSFGRVGLAVAGIAGVGMGVSQLDWARRNYELPGEVMASGTIAGGIGYAVNRLGGSPKTAMFAAAASFFGQMMLPGFDQGVVPGMATMYTRANTLRAADWNPVNYYRRTLEGYAPGITSWQTGAALGIGVAIGSTMRLPFLKERVPQMLLNNKAARDYLGLPKEVMFDGTPRTLAQPKTTRDLFWEGVTKDPVFRSTRGVEAGKYGNATGVFDRLGLRARLFMHADEFGGTHKLMSKLNTMWSTAEDTVRTQAKENPVNKAMLLRLEEISAKYQGDDFFSRIGKEAHGFGTQTFYSFFGAQASEEGTSEAIKSMGFGRLPLPDVFDGAIPGMPKDLPFSPTGKVGRILTLGMAAFGLHQLMGGGLLGSMQTADELRDVYSGRQLVEVKKSRWWEGGGTPFEGGATSYFRPHAYHLMMNRTREQGIWGEGEDRISPIGKFFKKNFTYDLEMMNYYDRPYPISSAAFADVPVIGGVLAATVGRFIKPPKLMHVNEWMRANEEGNLEYASTYEGWRREPAYSLGAKPPGIPSSPFATRKQFSYLSYQFRELEGMTGWAKNVMSDIIAGSDIYDTDQPLLADAGLMTSPRVRFWETQQGGLMFMNEIVRRILPRYRSEIERQNPLINSMPTWLPDRFRTGDPYRNVEWGEARLPGAGYSSLHPELRGVDAEDYPLVHRYAILSDVAPFSYQFRQAQTAMYRRRAEGLTTQSENAYMDAIDDQVRKRFNRKEFDAADPNAIQLPGSGITQAITGGMKKTLRKAVAPAEYLVPMGFRPVQKLMGDDRGPIEQYEYERLYGTQMAFWDKPWRDWFRPSMYSVMNIMGFEGKPAWRQEADANQEYFDKLEFVKWMKLAHEAERMGDEKNKHRYMYMAAGTRTGVNPQGNPLSIYWALPESERAFFNAFAHAEGSDRTRILEMVPEDQAHLYQAIWSRMDKGDPGLWAGSPSQVDDQHIVRQFYESEDYFRYNPTPEEDWIGWHEDADIGDIKVRYLNELGRDLHDYGEWEGSLKDAYAQPALEGSTNFLPRTGNVGRGGLWSTLNSFITGHTVVHTNQSIESRGKLLYNDDRHSEVKAQLGGYLGGY